VTSAYWQAWPAMTGALATSVVEIDGKRVGTPPVIRPAVDGLHYGGRVMYVRGSTYMPAPCDGFGRLGPDRRTIGAAVGRCTHTRRSVRASPDLSECLPFPGESYQRGCLLFGYE
jgi:hypothetical protein